MAGNFNIEELPYLLPIYYKRLFPFEQYHKWLSYGNVPSTYFSHREFSFTLADDIYIRYQSFKNKEEMEKEIQKKCPYKIDIGAVFSFRPKDHRTVNTFVPKEKELVFDIDMTDYDEVRYCCSGTDICSKCWKYMAIAVEILDSSLREDFGFCHILWVFSGRRGVHGWVCDASARALSQAERTAVAEYLQVVRGGDCQSKKVSFSNSDLHPFLRKSEEIISRHFKSLCLEDQDILENEEKWKKVLNLIPDKDFRETMEKLMPKCANSVQRWETIKREVENARSKKKGFRSHLLAEIMFQFVYPRLDINVSKGLNHLLKSPFSIHPKTGRVCVPFNVSDAYSFDLLKVPNISQIIEEMSAYDKENPADAESRIADYKKTSMKASVNVFEKFLNKLSKENAARRLDESDKKRNF